MTKHNVTIKHLRLVKNAKELIATADVNIDGMITVNNFKLLRKGDNGYYIYGPQTESNGTTYKIVEFLDWELEEEVKNKIIAAYKRKIQSLANVPEEDEEDPE